MQAATIVAVVNTYSNDLLVFVMDRRSGALVLHQTIPLSDAAPPAGTLSVPLAISPDRRTLYAALRFPPYGVVSFRVVSGRLRHLAHAPLPESMSYLATDKTGRFLFGASFGGNVVTSSLIGADGAVREPPGFILPTPRKPHSVTMDTANRLLYIPCLGDDVIIRPDLDHASGALNANDNLHIALPTGAGPRHFQFHPGGKFFSVVGETDARIHCYAFDADGVRTRLLESVGILPVGSAVSPAAADLHITRDPTFLYASERTTSSIAGFRVNRRTGRLSPIGRTETEQQPRAFGIDPRNRFLMAVGQLSHHLSVYRIDASTGRLTWLSRLATGRNPTWVEFIDVD